MFTHYNKAIKVQSYLLLRKYNWLQWTGSCGDLWVHHSLQYYNNYLYVHISGAKTTQFMKDILIKLLDTTIHDWIKSFFSVYEKYEKCYQKIEQISYSTKYEIPTNIKLNYVYIYFTMTYWLNHWTTDHPSTIKVLWGKAFVLLWHSVGRHWFILMQYTF